MLSAGADKALNSYFPMPYAHHARITITDEGKLPLNHLYWNIDYRVNAQPLPDDTLYFHAEYRQAHPTRAGPETGMKTRPDRKLSPQPRRQRQLRVVRSQWPWPVCRRYLLHPAKSGRLVGRRQRHVSDRRRYPNHRRHRRRRLLPRRMGLRQFTGLSPHAPQWSARARRRALQHVSLPLRLTHSLHQVHACQHGTRPCQPPLRQLLLGRLLVSG